MDAAMDIDLRIIFCMQPLTSDSSDSDARARHQMEAI